MTHNAQGKMTFWRHRGSDNCLALQQCWLAPTAIFAGCLVLHWNILTPKKSNTKESWSGFHEEKQNHNPIWQAAPFTIFASLDNLQNSLFSWITTNLVLLFVLLFKFLDKEDPTLKLVPQSQGSAEGIPSKIVTFLCRVWGYGADSARKPVMRD